MILGIFAATLTVGCSVKEDRSECPCALVLDFSGIDCDRSDSLRLSVLGAGDFLHKAVVQNVGYQYLYTVEAPKGNTWVNVYSVESGGEDFSQMISSDGDSLTIPLGEQCPQVNMFSYMCFLNYEIITVPVVLHKNYCTMSISLVAKKETAFDMTLTGNVCGYGRDGQPVEGDFRHMPEETASGDYTSRIPRQTDSSLRLIISDEDGILREFAIGEYIIESGYDWSAEDLEDIEIEINYSKTGVTFTIDDWAKTLEMEVVI